MNSKKFVEYRRFKIFIQGTLSERYVVEIAGEEFHFNTLEEAKGWIDFRVDTHVNYNSNVTC